MSRLVHNNLFGTAQEEKESYYFTLSFSYEFQYDDDTVSFAMTIPYTFTESCNHLDEILAAN